MTWFVSSDHVETLHTGLMVGPGEDAPDVDPELDQELIDRGALTWRAPEADGIDATDPAIALAKEHGIDLAEIRGTGSGGRIIEKDLKAAIEASETAGETPDTDEAGDSVAPETAASPQEEMTK